MLRNRFGVCAANLQRPLTAAGQALVFQVMNIKKQSLRAARLCGGRFTVKNVLHLAFT